MPSDLAGWLTIIGGLCFGIVVGWVTYRTLRYAPHGGLSDLSTVIGAVGGAAITALFPKDSGAFGAYCIGLAIGFFAYLRSSKDPAAPSWMGGTNRPGPRDSSSEEPLPRDAK